MTTPLKQTNSPKLRQRPFSQPIDQDAFPGGGLRHELVDVWSQRCAFVIDEILQTEGDYVNALDDIIQGYRVPLVTRLKSSSETQKLINSLFGNIDELHGLHMSLLKRLRVHDTDPHEFGQVFIRTEDGFKLYTAYCTNYNSSMLCLQQLLMSEKHNQFLDQCQRNLKHSLPLSAQLIKPVQRIMRYHLLLHELVKHFNPNHYGYPSLKQAHKTMAKIADHINKVKKREENEKRVKHLQTSLYGWKGNDAQDNLSVYGELLLESTCQVGTKKGTERQVLLFEKLLLILKKKDTKRYNYKAHIVASELCLDETQSSTNRTCFWIYSKTRRQIKYLIDPRSNSKRTEWVNAISDLTRKFSQDLEEEYGQFMKLKEVVLSNQSLPLPQKRDSPLVIQNQPSPDLKRRIHSQRKRRRDIREVFEPNEGVQLVSVRRARTDESTYQVPAQTEELEVPPSVPVPVPVPIATSEPANEEAMDQLHVPPGRRAESMESLLSLSDVELGMEEHAGDTEDVDYHKRKIKRRQTDLKRRQAIKVKRNPSNRSLNTSITTRIRMKAREAKEDVQGDAGHTAAYQEGGESMSEDETELAKLVAPPTDSSYLLDSSMDQDSLYNSSMGSSSLGQSMGGAGGVAGREGEAEVPHVPDVRVERSPEKQMDSGGQDGGGGIDLGEVPVIEEVDSVSDSGVQCDAKMSLRKISTGPPIQIIPDYRAREEGGTDIDKQQLQLEEEGEEEEEEDRAFATVLEDAGIGDSISLPEPMITGSEGDQDFVIVEDSSSDSEDEEEGDEEVGFNFLDEFDGASSVDVIPPPASFTGDQEVPSGESDSVQQQAWDSTEVEKSFQTKEQLSEFFTDLNQAATPDSGEPADISTSATADPEQQKPSTPSVSSEIDPHTTPQEKLPYRFTGNTSDFLATPIGFERARGAEIYATMPRHKRRPKIATASANSSQAQSNDSSPYAMAPLSPKRRSVTGPHPPRSAAARRAEGFSELLQFTRQQQFTPTPAVGEMDITQSLPSFASGQSSLDDARGLPLDDEDTGGLCDEFGESGSLFGESEILPQPSDEILDRKPLPSQADSKASKVSTVPQLQSVPESSEFIHVEEANGRAEFAISPPPPLGDSDHEKEDTAPSTQTSIGVAADDLEEKSETIEISDHKNRDSATDPSVHITTDDLEEKSETVETSDHDSAPSIHITTDDLEEKSDNIETNGLLDDAKMDTELAASPPVSDREQEKQSSDVTMLTESLAEKPEDGDTVNQMETTCSHHKPEETNGREEFISPPLADSDDDDEMEESEVAQEISAADNLVQKSEETNTPIIDDGELHVHDPSDSDRNNKESTPVDDYPTSDTLTETSKLQEQKINGDSPYHLRHRGTSAKQENTEKEQDRPEPETISDLPLTTMNAKSTSSKKEQESETSDFSPTTITTRSTSNEPISDSASTSILDSSREERESSVESGASESHSGLVQRSSPSHHQASTQGMLGWLHGVSRHVLFGLLPRTVGLRGGLIVVGVAAISSLLLYNLTGYASPNSTAAGR